MEMDSDYDEVKLVEFFFFFFFFFFSLFFFPFYDMDGNRVAKRVDVDVGEAGPIAFIS